MLQKHVEEQFLGLLPVKHPTFSGISSKRLVIVKVAVSLLKNVPDVDILCIQQFLALGDGPWHELVLKQLLTQVLVMFQLVEPFIQVLNDGLVKMASLLGPPRLGPAFVLGKTLESVPRKLALSKGKVCKRSCQVIHCRGSRG